MNTKVLGLLVVVVVVGGGAYMLLNLAMRTETDVPESRVETNNVSPMRAEENMVVVSQQRPGKTIAGSLIHLAASGYLVIHEDNNGAPGAILGASALLPAGDSSNVQVVLSRVARDGETLYAMLHFEKGGDTTFSATEDTPVGSRLGGPIHGSFEISSDVSAEVPVSI